jgi:hypothetical protein
VETEAKRVHVCGCLLLTENSGNDSGCLWEHLSGWKVDVVKSSKRFVYNRLTISIVPENRVTVGTA